MADYHISSFSLFASRGNLVVIRRREGCRPVGRALGGTMASGDGSGHSQDGLVNRLKRILRSKHPDDPCQEWRDKMKARLHTLQGDTLQGHRIPEYEAAILSCSVTLQQIIEARYKLHQVIEAQYKLHKTGHVPPEKDPLILYEELLWRTYEHAHGTIKEYYFSMENRAAAVLIEPHDRRAMDLDFFYPIDELTELTPDFETTLWTCVSQFQTIAQLDLDFKGQDAVFLELYLLVIYLFVVVESQQVHRPNRYRHALRRAKRILARGSFRRIATQKSLGALTTLTPGTSAAAARRVTTNAIESLISERIKEALKQANTRLGTLATRIDQFARREAQVVYVRAMLPGSLFVFTVVAVYVGYIFRLAENHRWTSETEMSWYLIAIAVSSGALGAMVSVMLRVANQPLSIDYHAGRGLIKLAGRFRPIVGAVFGLVFYLLINAGLLQVLAAPREIGSRAFFVAAVCFVAGFSERRAQDAIVRALPTGAGTEVSADKSPARRPEEGGAS
jgi:hypothetical protein